MSDIHEQANKIASQQDVRIVDDLFSQSDEIIATVERITGIKYTQILESDEEKLVKIDDITCWIIELVNGDYELVGASRRYTFDEFGEQVRDWHTKADAVLKQYGA